MLELILSSYLTAGLACTMVCLILWSKSRRPRDIPPGPRFTLPILGNLLQIGLNPCLTFRKMRKQYGDIFSVYLTSSLVIVINGYENLKEAFVKNADLFSNRAPIIYKTYSGKGIVLANGAIWKEQRKFATCTLRDLGMGRNILEGKIQEEITAFMDLLSSKSGQVIEDERLVQSAVANIVCTIIFGKRFQYDDPKYIKFLNTVKEDMNISLIVEYFPFLRFLPGDLFNIKRSLNNEEMVNRELINPAIAEHLKEYDEDNTNDFISAYIKELKRKEALGKPQTSTDVDHLRVSIANLIVAGTETTGTTIRWLLLCLLHYPEIQDKCLSEITKTVGRNRSISLQDKTKLPFIEATIMEALRFGNVAPLMSPFVITADTTFKGYRIPKDSIILANVDSVLSDPNIWGDPDNFRPDRFLDGNGKLTKPEEFIPFFVGPRNCLGESLARMELFLIVCSLIQKFQFVKAENEPLPSLEGEFRISHHPKPFKFRVIPRD